MKLNTFGIVKNRAPKCRVIMPDWAFLRERKRKLSFLDPKCQRMPQTASDCQSATVAFHFAVIATNPNLVATGLCFESLSRECSLRSDRRRQKKDLACQVCDLQRNLYLTFWR